MCQIITSSRFSNYLKPLPHPESSFLESLNQLDEYGAAIEDCITRETTPGIALCINYSANEQLTRT